MCKVELSNAMLMAREIGNKKRYLNILQTHAHVMVELSKIDVRQFEERSKNKLPLSLIEDVVHNTIAVKTYAPEKIDEWLVQVSIWLYNHQRTGNSHQSELLRRVSPVAWQHINLHGRYEFNKPPQTIDVASLVQQLAQYDIELLEKDQS